MLKLQSSLLENIYFGRVETRTIGIAKDIGLYIGLHKYTIAKDIGLHKKYMHIYLQDELVHGQKDH